MLTCKDIAERADAMLDGELSRWQVIQIRLHLAMCKGCSQFMGQMRTTRALIDASVSLQNGDTARVSAILSEIRSDDQPKR